MDCGVPVTGVALELHASREIVRHCERGANRALALRPPPRPPPRWLLERVDDADAVEIVEARQVFGVERLDAGFDTRSEDERVPEGGSSGHMEFFGASQVAIAGQDKGQEILKFTEAIPGVRRGEPLLAELSRSREEFAGDLP